MNREYHKWYSPHLNREMELLIFGHAGARVLIFPTSMGRFFEWEDRGMIAALHHQISQGWFQLYCVDSVDTESWYCKWCHPANRVRRHMQYEQYIMNEVLPFSLSKNDHPFLITTGASFGAYHAVNIAFRHPDRFDRVIGMSGIYDMLVNTTPTSSTIAIFHICSGKRTSGMRSVCGKAGHMIGHGGNK